MFVNYYSLIYIKEHKNGKEKKNCNNRNKRP